MQSGNGNKNSQKISVGLISHKTTLHLQHTFYLEYIIFFAIVLHNYNVKLPETSLLHVLWRKCCMFTVHYFFFFCCRSFSPRWPLAFLIFSPPLSNFHVFLLTELVSFVFYLQVQLFLCYPRQCRPLKYSFKQFHKEKTFFFGGTVATRFPAKQNAGCPKEFNSRRKNVALANLYPSPSRADSCLPSPSSRVCTDGLSGFRAPLLRTASEKGQGLPYPVRKLTYIEVEKRFLHLGKKLNKNSYHRI